MKPLLAWSLHLQKGVFLLLFFGLTVEFFCLQDFLPEDPTAIPPIPQWNDELPTHSPIKRGIREFRQEKAVHGPTKADKVVVKQDLNLAKADDLLPIYGIGPVLSQRIIKYRDALGGFKQESQLYKVYGLDSVVVLRLFDYFYLTNQ